MLNLQNILTKIEIDQLEETRNLKSTSKLVNWIAQTLNYFPWTYEYEVRKSVEDLDKNVENPLKTIIITSWLCHAANRSKLLYNSKPIRLKMDDYLVRHLWSYSLPTEHYSMCVESLYLFYQEINRLNTEFLSLDMLRVYPALKSNNSKFRGKQRSYLKVKEQICLFVEQAFLQHHLYLPTPSKFYNPMSSKDVDEWFSLILDVNRVNTVQLSNEILNYISQVQAVGQNYPSRRSTVKNVQPVWISF